MAQIWTARHELAQAGVIGVREGRSKSDPETVALLFREIMSACLALERPITVAYLGPKGTDATLRAG